MEAITNQHQQILYYLIKWDKFSLQDLIKDSMFYKAQTRLSEIENKHGTLCKREKRMFINRFGRLCIYNEYKCIDKEKAALLFMKYRSKNK